MKINQPAPTGFSGFESRTSSIQTAGSYRIGQVLEATVLANSSNGLVSLRLGSSELMSSTNVVLQQNSHLLLKVVQLQPQLVLRVQPSASENPLHEAVKNMLPRQTSLAPLLAELAHKIQARETLSNQPALREAGSLLLAAIPGRKDIKQAEGLQRVIQQSGLFLEAKLANSTASGTIDLSRDLKSLLLRFMDGLTRSSHPASATQTPAQNSKTSIALKDGSPNRQLQAEVQRAAFAAQSNNTERSAPIKILPDPLIRLSPLQAATVKAYGYAPVQSSIKQTGTTLLSSAVDNPSATQTKLMHNINTSRQAFVINNINILTISRNSAARPDPVSIITARSPDQTAQQLSAKQSAADIPPPLKGHLPVHQPRTVYTTPPEMQDVDFNSAAILKKAQGALARLGLLQVATAENFEDGKQLWQLEIPVRQGNAIETVSLTLEKDRKQTSPETPDQSSWVVNLVLDLPRLGPLQSRISMDSLGVSTTFWTESATTLSIIENRLAELRANLEQQGLTTHKLSCRVGQQTAASPSQTGSPLIDYQI